MKFKFCSDITLSTAAQQACMVRGRRRPFPPRRRAHDSMPCATRPDAPLPASTTCKKRNVSSSCGVRTRGPHPMHWPRPGESAWALKCSMRGASGGQTSPVYGVCGVVATDGATSASWYSQSPSSVVGRGGASGRPGGRAPHAARCRFIWKPLLTPNPQSGHRAWHFSRGRSGGVDMIRPSEEGGGSSCKT